MPQITDAIDDHAAQVQRHWADQRSRFGPQHPEVAAASSAYGLVLEEQRAAYQALIEIDEDVRGQLAVIADMPGWAIRGLRHTGAGTRLELHRDIGGQAVWKLRLTGRGIELAAADQPLHTATVIPTVAELGWWLL